MRTIHKRDLNKLIDVFNDLGDEETKKYLNKYMGINSEEDTESHLKRDFVENNLSYGKYQYDSLVALFRYENKNIVAFNKNRAIASISCLRGILDDTEQYINSLE